MSLFRPRPLWLLPLALALVIAPAVYADDTDAARLEALRQAVAQIGQPDAAPAQVCWTPHERFSPVGVAAEVPYGPRLLVARYDHPPVAQNTPCQAVWTHEGQPLSTGDCTMRPGEAFVTNGVRRPDAPLLPGVYRCVFRAGGKDLAFAELRILSPAPLGNRQLADVIREGGQHLATALKQVDASQAQAAGAEANQALPLLATAVLANPQGGDVAAMLEIAQSVVAIGRMESTAANQQAAQALDWAERAVAHARTAEGLAADAQLKAAAKQMADTLEQALPKLQGAGAAG